MSIFEPLVFEHDRILEALDLLDGLADRLDAPLEGAELSAAAAELATLLRFLRRYADACHHAKEEQILFRELAAAGMPTQGGPIAVMLAEHDEGRALIRRVAQASEQLDDPNARAEARAAARSFCELLRNHIDKENEVLYPMGRGLLDPSKDAQMLEQYEKYEAQVMSAGEKQELLDQLAALRAAQASDGC